MNYSFDFFESILDSISEHLVVIDRWGVILYVNRAWIEFGIANGVGAPQWIGTNYFEACERSAAAGDTSAHQAVESMRQVINKQSVVSYVEYPCHSLTEQRWFIMRMTGLRSSPDTYLISHRNMTDRKLIEEKIRTKVD
jgi:PAS domain-containing protein